MPNMLAIIAGIGSIGRRHIRNLRQLRPEIEMVGVRRAQSRDEDFPERALLDSVITYEELDGVLGHSPSIGFVTSPAPYHLELARRLLEGGLHLLIEKPVSHSSVGLEELSAVAKAKQRAVLVGYNLRFSTALNCFRESLERVGEPLGLRCSVGMYLPHWRPQQDYRDSVSARRSLGGGALLELSHELDYLNWLFGPVERLVCTAGTVGPLEMDVENWVDLLLAFGSGLRGTLHLDLLDQSHHRVCRLVGSKGTLEWDGIANSVKFWGDSQGLEVIYEDSAEDRNHSYLAEMSHFLEVVAGRETPSIPLAEGVGVIRLVEAAKLSAKRREWVACED